MKPQSEKTPTMNEQTDMIIARMFECCFQAPHMDFCMRSRDSAGKVFSIEEHGNNRDLVVVPEWVSGLLIGCEVPDAN
jgi:hypothetical protein